MPCLQVATSGGAADGDHAAFLAAASKLVAVALGKDEKWITVRCEAGVRNMIFGGTADPCAQCALYSIGALGQEPNTALSAGLAQLLQVHFNVAPIRYYLNFFDMERQNCGWSGGTFA